MDRLDLPQLRKLLRARIADQSTLSARRRGSQRFSPSLSYGRHFGPPYPSAKPASVMVLLEHQIDDGWSIPLTVRPLHLPDHPGQISLPGGRVEAGEDFQQAAEREFCEELGCEQFPGEVLGQLQPLYVYNSDYFVTPFVAVAQGPIRYTPCKREVERLLTVPITALSDPSCHREAEFSRGKAVWRSPTILACDQKIWGATAIILGEVAALLEHPAQR